GGGCRGGCWGKSSDAADRGGGKGPARRRRRRHPEERQVRRVSEHGGRGPEALRAWPIRWIRIHRGRRPRFEDRDLRRSAVGDRELALGGGTILRPHG